MILRTEIDTNNQKALIIAPEKTVFLDLLKKKLQDMNVVTAVRSKMIDSYEEYSFIILLNYSLIIPSEFRKDTEKKILYILFHQQEKAATLSSYVYDHDLKHVKIIRIDSSAQYFTKDIDTLLWFTFSRTSDNYLHIYHQKKQQHQKQIPHKISIPLWKRFTHPQSLMTIGLICMLISQLLFIPPLLASTFFHYQEAENAFHEKPSSHYSKYAGRLLYWTKRMYQFAQPTYHFLSIALPVEDLIQINESMQQVLVSRNKLRNAGTVFLDSLMIKNKTDAEYQAMLSAKNSIEVDTKLLSEHIQILGNKLPTWSTELKNAKESLEQSSHALRIIQELLPHFDSIFAKGTEKKYLMLFANNMELRPGGGFIGSFAFLKMNDYTLQDLTLYDVYDADGQLRTHIDPPKPISKFLNQTHWFLRDSAFTGDFVDNLKIAEQFLKQETGESNFDGGILITTTGVQNLLKSVKSVYIPDFKESINSDNFYIKAQLYAEEDFFPGSKQKKSFLSSVARQMLFGFQDASLPTVFSELEKSLDQKQLVMYATDSDLQELFKKNYWSGRILKPTCTLSDALHCIPDYLFPLDANLGVNKANFYTSNPMKLHVNVDPTGNITNTFSITYTNDSHKGVFPGGTYKNYFQILIPPNAYIESVQVDGVPVEEYDETNFEYKVIGFLVSIEPQQSKKVQIVYKLPTTIVSGNGTYQFILQKQIGSQNADFQFTFSFPKSMTITRHNLSPLAQDNEIIYNTSVSSDKIFLIEFTKK